MTQFDTPPEMPAHTGKIHDQDIRQTARYAWKVPLVGLLITMVLNYAGTIGKIPLVGAAGGVIFVVCLIIGLVVSVLNWTRVGKYQGVLGHAVAGTVVSIGFLLLMASLFASLSQVRHVSRTMQSATQLRAIQQGMLIYAQDSGTFPDHFGRLVTQGILKPPTLVMPDQDPPPSFDEWSIEQQTQWAVDNSPYRFPILGRSAEQTQTWRVVGYMRVLPGDENTNYHVISPDAGTAVEDRVMLEAKLKQQGLTLE